MFDVAIVIVTWNNASDIERCLASLAGVGKGIEAQIVVIDNASHDGTVEKVRRGYPHVQLIVNTQNVGFAAANNQAFNGTASRYVMLLNPDTSVDAGTIEALVNYMDHRPVAWVAGPMILNPDRTVQRSGVRFPSLWNLLVESLFLDRLFPKNELFGAHKEVYRNPCEPRSVDYLQGSALMVRREALEKVGGLDEGFFMYFEETDWCFRIKQAGGDVQYAPVGSVIHFGGEAFAHFDERRLVYYHRSMLRFFRKHSPGSRLLGLRAILAVRSCIRLLIWVAISLASPSKREKAWSSARGYQKVLGVLFQGG
jgi:N-acetylglucosaminyl-diphospho-decaprenol L-rhamnosyltransferase